MLVSHPLLKMYSDSEWDSRPWYVLPRHNCPSQVDLLTDKQPRSASDRFQSFLFHKYIPLNRNTYPDLYRRPPAFLPEDSDRFGIPALPKLMRLKLLKSGRC